MKKIRVNGGSLKLRKGGTGVIFLNVDFSLWGNCAIISNYDFPSFSSFWNGLKASWTRLFFIFCQIFAIFDDSSNWRTPKGLRNFEKIIKFGQNLCTKWRRRLIKLSINPFFGYSPKIRFRVLDLSLVYVLQKSSFFVVEIFHFINPC